jgi:hypothetical protein
MTLRSHQWSELAGITLILLSTGAQIFWVQPYERDIESRERYSIESTSMEDRRRFWSTLDRAIAVNQIMMLRELNSDLYEEKKKKLAPILNLEFLKYSEEDYRNAFENAHITPEIKKSKIWNSINATNPFQKTARYWLTVQKERLEIATYVTFGFFLLGSVLTGIGRASEMRRTNTRDAPKRG